MKRTAPLLLLLFSVAVVSSPAALASAPRGSAAPLSLPLERALEVDAPQPTETGFDLFAGDELARSENDQAQTFHPLAAVSLLSIDGAEAPLVSVDELIYPKTHVWAFDAFSQKVIGVSSGLSVELDWGSARFSAGLASDEREDPLGLAGVGDCGFWCSLGAYWKGVGSVAVAPGVLTYNLTGALLYASTPEGHRERYREQYEATRKMGGAMADDPVGFVVQGVAAPARKVNAAIESGDVQGASEGLGNLTGQIATVRAGTSGASVSLVPSPALAASSNVFVQGGGALVMTAPPYLGGASVLMTANAANQNAAGQARPSNRPAPAPENYRGRYNAQRAAEGKPRLPDDWDAHHRIPSVFDEHPEFRNFDFNAPQNIRGVPGSRAPANVHQQITNEWESFRAASPNATRADIEAFANVIDQQYAQHWFR